MSEGDPIKRPAFAADFRNPNNRFIFQGGSVFANSIADALQGAQLPMLPPEANWPEDARDENGNYQCLCLECRGIFIGYKRRVMCKQCSNKDEKK